MPEVKRTLVKSGPELWAEVTDPAAVGRHLEAFGSVRITHAEPERLVEWEGDRARGTVRLEPSGLGTRVVLTADTRPPAPPPDEPQEPVAGRRAGLWRLFARRAANAPAATREPAAEPSVPDDRATEALSRTLDALGAARHRPFSRA